MYLSKSPIGSMNSNSKTPKIITSTSNTINGNKKRSRSITPLIKSKMALRQSSSAKNIYNKFMREKSANNSRLNLTNLYSQNFSYVKRIKEMNSFNYNNKHIKKIMSNINSINNNKSKNKKRNHEIISSYSISSSNILKQIRKTNYNKNRANIMNNNLNNNYMNDNNPVILYKNVNINQQTKRNNVNNNNNKIQVELELNADSQTFNKSGMNNYNNKKMNKNNKSNNKYSIKNNIINKNNSTINIGSMKMAMNGNININVVIKGNNNTTNLINKIEVKKRSGENYSKNRNNKKKFERSHSMGYLKFN